MNDIDKMTAREKEMYETPDDQWKGCGICEKCRRRKYCGKECSAHRRSMNYWIENEIVRRLMGGKTDEGREHRAEKH